METDEYPALKLPRRTERILNVGSGPIEATLSFPGGYTETRLDIDPASGAHLIADARRLPATLNHSFDVVWCSHMLEHVYPHEVLLVLRGFYRVLRRNGHVIIKCPNLLQVAKELAEGRDPEAPLYDSPAGPISSIDLIYGYAPHIRDVSEWYAHKTGFTRHSLMLALNRAGFDYIDIQDNAETYELTAQARRP